MIIDLGLLRTSFEVSCISNFFMRKNEQSLLSKYYCSNFVNLISVNYQNRSTIVAGTEKYSAFTVASFLSCNPDLLPSTLIGRFQFSYQEHISSVNCQRCIYKLFYMSQDSDHIEKRLKLRFEAFNS